MEGGSEARMNGNILLSGGLLYERSPGALSDCNVLQVFGLTANRSKNFAAAVRSWHRRTDLVSLFPFKR